LLLEIIAEESVWKPLFNPRIILKMRLETLANEKAKAIFLKAHNLALERGTLYFANLLEKSRKYSTFSASGFGIEANSDRDWEINTLRTGCLGYVTINLPRIAYESAKDKKKFAGILKERLEMATRALEIKDRALRHHGKTLLPFLMQSANGDHYFRLENCSRIINLAGLKETVEAFHENDAVQSKEALEFAEQIAHSIPASMQRMNRKHGRLLFADALPDPEAAERLARVDIEKYGVAKVRFSGTRENPFYSTLERLMIKDGKISPELLTFGQKMHELYGRMLTVIELEEHENSVDELVSMTKQLFESHRTDFLTYNRRSTYCINCKKSWKGLLNKCPSCGAIGTLTVFDRFALAQA
jgi:ribonucleoside-triphosphate reductase